MAHFSSKSSDPRRKKWFHTQSVFEMSWIYFHSQLFWSNPESKIQNQNSNPLFGT